MAVTGAYFVQVCSSLYLYYCLQALASVGKKLLANTDLGHPEVAKAVEHYMPTAFLAVNKTCKRFATAESKYVYTTPKSYLEMLHLYNSMLTKKRALMDKVKLEEIIRCSNQNKFSNSTGNGTVTNRHSKAVQSCK